MPKDIVVVAAAYGSQKVRELGGQRALIPIVAAAGADGIEIRRELLSDDELTQIPALGQAIASAHLDAFYSVPDALFTAGGQLNPDLDRHLREAEHLRARLIKYSLGHYRKDFQTVEIESRLAGKAIQLVVENDQTECGKLNHVSGFFHAAGGQPFCHGLTFDMGNWLWVGDSPLRAAEQLNTYVSYIHVKAAERVTAGWRAIPLDDADDLWRKTLALLPDNVPHAIEFPLEGTDLVAITRHYVDLLRKE